MLEVAHKRIFRTPALVALAVLAAGLSLSCGCVTSLQKAREGVLQQNLFTLRRLVAQYKADKDRRPQSLDELVTSGYLKQVPADPMTGRNDSWVVEWSGDPKTPGVVNVRSSSNSISSKGTAYRDW